MKRAARYLSLLTAAVLTVSAWFPSHAADRTSYTYTVTFSAGTQGTLDSSGISVDGGGDYAIDCDGQHVTITGLTSANHVRFLNSAVTLEEDSKYYVKGVRVGGRDNSTVDLAYFPVERDEDYVVAYGIRGNLVQYTVYYQDTAGNDLYPPQNYYGNVGDRPVVAYLYVEGYQPQAYNLTRTLQEDAGRNVFTFVYAPIPTVTVPQPPEVTPAPVPGQPEVTPLPGAQVPVPEAPAPGEDTEQGEVPEGGEQPPDPDEDASGVPEQDIQDNEIPQNQGPEDLRDLDEEETPLGAYEPGDEGTIAAANREKSRYALLAGGIGLAALLTIGAGAYAYRKMRRSRSQKPEEQGRKR